MLRPILAFAVLGLLLPVTSTHTLAQAEPEGCYVVKTRNVIQYPSDVPITFRNALTCDTSVYYDIALNENRYDYPKDCHEVLTMGFATNDGTYTVYPNGSGSNVEKECRFRDGAGYTETTYAYSSDPADENIQYLDGNGNVTDTEWGDKTTRYRNNGWESLIQAKETHGVLIYEIGGTLIDRYATRDLPVLPETMTAVMQVNNFRGSKTDADEARLWFQLIDYDGNITTVFDTGYYAGGTNRQYTFNLTIPTTTDQVRWWGRCYRKSGSGCGAYIANLSLTLNPELLQEGQPAFARVVN